MGDAGLDECVVVGKLKGAGNEERIEGRSKEVCKVHILCQGLGRRGQPATPATAKVSRVLASPHES